MTVPGRRLRGGGALAAASLLAGCLQIEPGANLRDDELERVRVRAEAVRFAETGTDRAVVIARGRRVVVQPVGGLCLAADAFDSSANGAFLVIADCITARDQAVSTASDGSERIDLPPAFAGLVTVSVSGEAMFAGEDGRAGALRRLRDFLGTAPGLALLGRNGPGEEVDLVEARQVGDALYVHVRDPAGSVAFLSRDFWRGFAEINGRLVLVTVSGFADRPLAGDDMLAVLAGQIARIRSANGAPAFEAELALAGGLGAAIEPGRTLVRSDPTGGLEALRDEIAGRVPAPPRAPTPREREGVRAAAVAPEAPSSGGGSPHAPLSAPRPPGRRARG